MIERISSDQTVWMEEWRGSWSWHIFGAPALTVWTAFPIPFRICCTWTLRSLASESPPPGLEEGWSILLWGELLPYTCNRISLCFWQGFCLLPKKCRWDTYHGGHSGKKKPKSNMFYPAQTSSHICGEKLWTCWWWCHAHSGGTLQRRLLHLVSFDGHHLFWCMQHTAQTLHA